MPVSDGAAARSQFDRPVFIVSAPRSGSTLLFETLAQSPDVASIGGESHRVIEGVPELSMPARDWSSNRLVAADASPEVAERLAGAFHAALRDRDGLAAEGRVRMLEKTPKNALRVPFFKAIWPDAEFVFLYRDVRQTLASMMEAWASGYFRTYPRLPGWSGPPWSMLLVPGWQGLDGLPLPEIVAHQWAITIDLLIADLQDLPPACVRAVDYAAFLQSPTPTAAALARSAGIGWDRSVDELPLSKTTVSRPSADKWRRFEAEIEAVMPIVDAADTRARAFLADRLV